MSRNELVGKCFFCKNEYSKRGMGRHLEKCPQRKQFIEQVNKNKKSKETEIFHLRIEDWYLKFYWLHIEMPGKATLDDLDTFLKNIWVECCGHLSEFTIDSVHYSGNLDYIYSVGELSPRISINKVLKVGTKFSYIYDFGSSTKLKIKVVSSRKGATINEPVLLMARNNPPEIICSSCNDKKATFICTECYEEPGWLCNDCTTKHEHGEDVLLPVVNSPRLGVCGYDGYGSEEYAKEIMP